MKIEESGWANYEYYTTFRHALQSELTILKYEVQKINILSIFVLLSLLM